MGEEPVVEEVQPAVVEPAVEATPETVQEETVVKAVPEELPPVKVSIYNPSLRAFQDVTLLEAREMRDTFMSNLPALEAAITAGEQEQANRDAYNNFIKSQGNGN